MRLIHLTAALATFAPTAALACGGLFCSAGPSAAPVDQNAERIIFEVDAGTICAHVQIEYAGAADEFAWIVPVPEVPDLEESDEDFFRELDGLTAPQILLPAPDFSDCQFGGSAADADESSGCGCDDQTSSIDRLSSPDAGADFGGESTVQVFATFETINYEATVLGAETAGELVEWLQDNQYNVSDNMIPVMQPYVDEAMKFVAVKLREGRSAQDIAPVKMCYPGTEPMIPIRLTAVAAQPMMGILVFILGDTAFGPANFMAARPAESEILFDANGRTNYLDWVARAADDAGGRLFVAEYLGDNFSSFPQRWLSRFYTRLGPQHMTVDPVFSASPAGALRVDPLIDLSGQTPVVGCNGPIPERQPNACAFNFCGREARCAVHDEAAGCLCPAGQVAQAVAGPDGPRVTCSPAENPFGITADALQGGDPCAFLDCGAGACVVKGGFPTCRCDAAALARLDAGGKVRCVAVAADVATFGPGAGSESAGERPGVSRSTLRRRPISFTSLLALLAVVAFGAATRRR